VLVVVAVVLLAFEYTANWRRQTVWQTPASLWTDVLRQYPNLAQAHIGMANAHYREGDFAAALVSAQEAVRTSSGYWAEPYSIRALCLWQTGRREEALADLRTAQSLSRAYTSEKTLVAALMFSPVQIAAFREMLRVQGP
jgi:Flp pilus assembly protein TadD